MLINPVVHAFLLGTFQYNIIPGFWAYHMYLETCNLKDTQKLVMYDFLPIYCRNFLKEHDIFIFMGGKL